MLAKAGGSLLKRFIQRKDRLNFFKFIWYVFNKLLYVLNKL